MDVAPPAQTSIFLAFACTSWALVEVPRYLFYAFNLMDSVPYPLFWLRYRYLRKHKRLELIEWYMEVSEYQCLFIFSVSACTLMRCSIFSVNLVFTMSLCFYHFYIVSLTDNFYSHLFICFSLFAILYPTGITGELGCMYMAAVYLYETKVSVLRFRPSCTYR